MSGGERPEPEDATTEHRAVAPEASPGTVHVDRSAFGRHQGLFVVNQGPKAGARYALDSDVVSVGRDPDSDIFLDDITVSRRHAEVARDGARYSIRDAGSLNGTYVNRRLVDEGELNEGDEVQVGKFKLVFVHGTSPR
ncbi:MAG: FHA domain-containing protein [Acidimicrobiaceae bacterium]|nr:FHA domain-containing protein [Acidimicrobiaceae bacterium]